MARRKTTQIPHFREVNPAPTCKNGQFFVWEMIRVWGKGVLEHPEVLMGHHV